MASVALVGLVEPVAEVIEAALQQEGHASRCFVLDADIMRTLARWRGDVVVLDGHAYVNSKAFLTDLRAQPETAAIPVVLIGPERPAEVPHFEVVYRLGRALDLERLLAAVRRVARPDVG